MQMLPTEQLTSMLFIQRNIADQHSLDSQKKVKKVRLKVGVKLMLKAGNGRETKLGCVDRADNRSRVLSGSELQYLPVLLPAVTQHVDWTPWRFPSALRRMAGGV